MEAELPHDLFEAREALWKEIQIAFAGADRRNGMSWSDAVLESDSSTTEEYIRACQYDYEESWLDLVENSPWHPLEDTYWIFLDPIGFRYYLPAAMGRCLRLGADEPDIIDCLAKDWKTKPRQTVLDSVQRLCVDRFLRLMIPLSEHTIRVQGLEEWSEWTRIETSKEKILKALERWSVPDELRS